MVRRADGEEGVRFDRSNRRLIVIDMLLPQSAGSEVIRSLRPKDPDPPILVLSAKIREGDKVLALSLRRDDYITKPFGVAELMRASATRAAAQRDAPGPPVSTASGRGPSTSKAAIPHRRQDSGVDSRGVSTYGATSSGAVLGGVLREQLMQAGWGHEHYARCAPSTNVRGPARDKIESNPTSRGNETVRGVGYRFNA